MATEKAEIQPLGPGQITPYYLDDFVALYLGDCREVQPWLAADVLITDPPYGVGGKLSSSWRGKKPRHWTPTHDRQEWDKTLDVRDAVLGMWGDRPYAMFGSPRRLDGAPPHREAPLVWDKGELVGMGDTGFPWGISYELIYVYGDGWTGRRTVGVLRHPHTAQAASRVGHPTPKPVSLMERLVAAAPPGVVADPFAGSGSTLVAAKAVGRKAVGVELDERYCEIAAKRLAQGVMDFGEAS